MSVPLSQQRHWCAINREGGALHPKISETSENGVLYLLAESYFSDQDPDTEMRRQMQLDGAGKVVDIHLLLHTAESAAMNFGHYNLRSAFGHRPYVLHLKYFYVDVYGYQNYAGRGEMARYKGLGKRTLARMVEKVLAEHVRDARDIGIFLEAAGDDVLVDATKDRTYAVPFYVNNFPQWWARTAEDRGDFEDAIYGYPRAENNARLVEYYRSLGFRPIYDTQSTRPSYVIMAAPLESVLPHLRE